MASSARPATTSSGHDENGPQTSATWRGARRVFWGLLGAHRGAGGGPGDVAGAAHDLEVFVGSQRADEREPGEAWASERRPDLESLLIERDLPQAIAELRRRACSVPVLDLLALA